MAINRFALVTDGFDSPGEAVGNDFASKTGRALLVTWGLLNRGIEEAGLQGSISSFMLMEIPYIL